MSTMPKGRIALPPTPEPPRPAYHPFVVPKPSVSVNENVFDNIDNDPSLHDVKQAIGALRIAVENVQRGCVALHQDEMRTEAARHQEALSFAFKVTKNALMSHDSAMARLNSELSALRAKVSQPAVIRDALASEIRTALRAMKPTERSSAILAAAKQGDDSLASAVLNAPSMLSGMSMNEIANVRARWGSERFPDLVTRIAALEKAETHLERAGKLALAYSFEIADRQLVDKALATQRRAAEAVAAASQPLLN